MPLQSLATTAQTQSLTDQIAAIYQYLAANVEPMTVNVGETVPAVDRQAMPWIKTSATGVLDGVFTFHNDNWHTRMPIQVGTVSLFLSAATLELGWEVDSSTGLSPGGSYQFRKFSGTGLLVLGQYAYRRHDQALG